MGILKTGRDPYMTAQEFAQALKDEKEGMLSSYFGRGESPAATLLKNLGAPSADENVLREFIDGVLTDAFYTMLLGFDGETALGRSGQQKYFITLEDGSIVSEANGDLSNGAYAAFYGES